MAPPGGQVDLVAAPGLVGSPWFLSLDVSDLLLFNLKQHQASSGVRQHWRITSGLWVWSTVNPTGLHDSVTTAAWNLQDVAASGLSSAGDLVSPSMWFQVPCNDAMTASLLVVSSLPPSGQTAECDTAQPGRTVWVPRESFRPRPAWVKGHNGECQRTDFASARPPHDLDLLLLENECFNL